MGLSCHDFLPISLAFASGIYSADRELLGSVMARTPHRMVVAVLVLRLLRPARVLVVVLCAGAGC